MSVQRVYYAPGQEKPASVLHVIQEMTLGGAARSVITAAKASSQAGSFKHRIISLLPCDPKAAVLANQAGVELINAPELDRIRREIEIADVVHIHWWNNPDLQLLLRQDLPPARVLLWLHVAGNSSPQIVTDELTRFSDITLASNPHSHIALPAFQRMREAGQSRRLDMVYDPADFARIEGYEKQMHTGFRIGYIGTVDFCKMHPDFVSMSAEAQIPDVTFIVCGAGGALPLLDKQIAQRRAGDRFSLLGYVEDIRPLMATFDVYGYPLCEGTYASGELNLQEIMFAGIPPVVFPYGGVKSLVQDGYTGLVVDTPSEYSRALEYLYHNPEERRRFGENASLYARALFGGENCAKKLNPIYAELLKLPKRHHAWGLNPGNGPIELQPKDLSDFPPLPQGAQLFLDSLGESGGDFQASAHSDKLEHVLDAEDRILNAPRVVHWCGTVPYRNRFPNDPWLRLWSGLGFLKNGEWRRALEDFREAIRNEFSHWRIYYYLALAEHGAGLKFDALKSLEKVLQHAPEFESAAVLQRKITGKAEQCSPPRARAASEPADSPSRPTHPLADQCFQMAEKHLHDGNLELARDFLERGLDAEPGHPDARLALGNLSFQLGELDKAIEWFQAAIPSFENDPLPRVFLASAAIQLGKVEIFEEALSKALQIDPSNPQALRLLANVNFQQGRYPDAAGSFANLLKQDPTDIDSLLAIGRCFYETGEWDAARSSFTEALRHDPANEIAKENLAVLEAELQEPRKAGPSLKPELNLEGQCPLVSVIVSTYNAEALLPNCLDDLEAQTIAHQIEIIVIDSGSEQNEARIVADYQARYRNIRYLRTEREPLYAAWNRAVSLARGKYITNANTDDAHSMDALEKFAAALESNPDAALAYADVLWTSEPNAGANSGKVIRKVRYPDYHPAIALFYCYSGCHQFWRKSALDELGPFNENLLAVADYELLLRLTERGLRAVHIPEFLSCFYQNAGGITQRDTQSAQEENEVRNAFRKAVPIEHFVCVDLRNASDRAEAWTALGNLAANYYVPWHDTRSEDLDYASKCYQRALEENPACFAARRNLCQVLLNQGRRGELEATLKGAPPEVAEKITQNLKVGAAEYFPSFYQNGFPRLLADRIDTEAPAEAVHTVPETTDISTQDVESEQTDRCSTPSQPQVRTPLRWLGPIFNPSGYATEAFNFILPLSRRINLAIHHQNQLYSEKYVSGLAAEDRELLFQLRDRFPSLTGGIAISHNPAIGFLNLPDALFHIGRTMFETDRIPKAWISCCNRMDEIWVPSRFNLETFAACGVDRDKLIVIPGAVDEQLFNPELATPWPLPNQAGFNFLSVFEWSARKGWDVLLAAYLKEFSAEDDVCLYLRTYMFSQPEGDPTAALWQAIREFAATLDLGAKPWPRIEILKDQVPTADLPRLYQAADCLVAPSRGEGWGRPQHEAMMMGVPVIATRWSGNTEFMNDENSFLLDYDLVPTRGLEPELQHYRGHRWANPSESQLRQQMRSVQQNPDHAKAKGQKARAHVLEHFSREPVADRVTARLMEIEKRLTTPALPAAAARSLRLENLPAKSSASASLAVAWEGSFLDYGSLSHINREVACRLKRQRGIQLSYVGKNLLAPGQAEQPELKKWARQLSSRAPASTQITVRHAWPPNWDLPARGAWVMIQPWEYGVLPADWVRQLGKVDEAWVHSEYLRKVYISSGVDPDKVKLVPLGIDPDRFHPEATPYSLPTRKRCKFLFVGGTIYRKGADLLLKTYLEQFTAADDVCLVIKDFGGQSVYAGQTLESRIQAAQQLPDAPEILYLTDEFAPDQMPGLYTACDCLVHPYRGEGFGLPVLEAMACGLPVIVTGGGSTDDFAGDEHAYRLPALRTSIGGKVGQWELIQNGWILEPSPQALADAMKQVLRNPDEARVKGLSASDYVRNEWTWERTAQIVARRLQDLAARRQAEAKAQSERRRRKAPSIELPPVARLGQLNDARNRLNQKEFVPAWETTLEAIRQRPFHPEAWKLLAEIAAAADDMTQAKQCAAEAVRLAPQWQPAKKLHKSLKKKTGTQRIEWPALPQHSNDSAAPHSAPRISVCMITRNEEEFIGQCLDSIIDLAHEIIVVDTGSTDRTLEIARAKGAETFSFPWQEDFSAARNRSIERAGGDWILILDADEELLPESRRKLLEAVREPGVLGYRLAIQDVGREAEGLSYVPRLFRNAPGLFFVGRVHEQIFSSLEVRRQEWGLENAFSEVTLRHHGYTKELTSKRQKVARNLRLLDRAVEEFPNEPNLVMNLGLELVRAGHLDAGLEQYWEAFHLASDMPRDRVAPELRESLLTQLGTHLLSSQQFAETIRLFNTPLAKAAPPTASFHFILGLAYMECKQWTEALDQFEECVKKRHLPSYSPAHREVHRAGPQHCLALSHLALNQLPQASRAFQAALADNPHSRSVRMDYTRFLHNQGEAVEAFKLLHQQITEYPEDREAWELGGDLALQQPAHWEFAKDWTGEALNHFPQSPVILRQHAEALLLNQNITPALDLWSKLASNRHPRFEAARLLCELLSQKPSQPLDPEQEPKVSKEFIHWYRRLLDGNAKDLVGQLNDRLQELQTVLPSAARVLNTALAEAANP